MSKLKYPKCKKCKIVFDPFCPCQNPSSQRTTTNIKLRWLNAISKQIAKATSYIRKGCRKQDFSKQIKMFQPINKIAHGIGMQNQYLYLYVYDGDIDGITNPPSHNYHSNKAQVELKSLLSWIHTRYPDYWSKQHYERAVTFVQQQLSDSEDKSSMSKSPKGDF